MQGTVQLSVGTGHGQEILSWGTPADHIFHSSSMKITSLAVSSLAQARTFINGRLH